MSWGERSCIHCNNCPIPEECEPHTCNVKCRKYEWDKEIPFDLAVEYILGRPNFQVANIAKRLIELGLYKERLDNKAESEQSIAIHFMLNLYLKHGEDWKDELDKALK